VTTIQVAGLLPAHFTLKGDNDGAFYCAPQIFEAIVETFCCELFVERDREMRASYEKRERMDSLAANALHI